MDLEFSCFNNLADFIRKLEVKDCFNVYVRSSKLLSDKMNPCKYEKIVYYCKCGGKTFHSTATIRKTSSFQKQCPVMIGAYYVKSRNVLRISKFIREHNHPTDVKEFKRLPKERRMKKSMHDKRIENSMYI